MKVSEEQRRELFDRLRSVLDERTATLQLEVTVPANVELATRGDVQELRAELLLRLTELAGRITELDGRLTGQITALDGRITELAGRITELDSRMAGGFAAMRERVDDLEKVMTRKLYARVIPAIGLMIGLAAWLG